ncbi:MAG: hypothetical protein PHN64_03890 [Desulfovibrionaceae bacterium]|nr:hypothetical protein [Desulfovibrionaceae bacterium]
MEKTEKKVCSTCGDMWKCEVFGNTFMPKKSVPKSRCIDFCERKALKIVNDAVMLLSCKQEPNVREKSTDDATLHYLKNMFGM